MTCNPRYNNKSGSFWNFITYRHTLKFSPARWIPRKHSWDFILNKRGCFLQQHAIGHMEWWLAMPKGFTPSVCTARAIPHGLAPMSPVSEYELCHFMASGTEDIHTRSFCWGSVASGLMLTLQRPVLVLVQSAYNILPILSLYCGHFKGITTVHWAPSPHESRPS